MYHCGTKPVLAHIANGMYGAIVVDPKEGLPAVDNEYVLVASEWYLNGDGIEEPASLDMAKARSMMPDWTTFNGYANQYVTHPLTAEARRDDPLLRRRRRPDARHELPCRGRAARPRLGQRRHDQPAPDRRADRARARPAAAPSSTSSSTTRASTRSSSHAFAHVDLGQVGLLKVGNPKGTMSH